MIAHATFVFIFPLVVSSAWDDAPAKKIMVSTTSPGPRLSHLEPGSLPRLRVDGVGHASSYVN
jgi:hypothetical protein